MRYPIFLIFSLLFILGSMIQPVTAEELSEYEINARNFTFNDISFGDSLAKVRKVAKFNGDLEDACDKKNSVYACLFKTKLASNIACLFFKDQVYEIRVIYSGKSVNKMGGVSVFLTKIVEKFGFPSDRVENDNKEQIEYKFPAVERKVTVFIDYGKDFARIDVTDTKLLDEMLKLRESNADLGF